MYAGLRRFYVVVKCQERPAIVGVWWSTWQHFRGHLPHSFVDKCVGLTMRGFDDYPAALAFWRSYHGGQRSFVRNA